MVLIGRLTRDPEMRYTQDGTAVASFDLAVDRRFASKSGEKVTDFIRIVTWRKLAETCANNLSKGRLVAVDGRLQTGSFEGRDGVRRRTVNVVADDVRFLDRPRQGDDMQDMGPDLDGIEGLGLGEDDMPF